MRELIVTEMVSLDGVLEAPGGEAGYRNAGWTFDEIGFDPAAYELKGTEQEEAGALLLGRTSYQAFAPVWPQMDDFTLYNAMPRFVVSTSLDTDDEHWPATILRNLEEVRELKAGELGDFEGPILVHGSGTLVKGLQEEGLIDKLHLLLFPVLLGQGKRLFSEVELSAQHLELEAQESYSNGI